MERVPRRGRILPKGISLFDYEVPINLDNVDYTTTNIQRGKSTATGTGLQRNMFRGSVPGNHTGDVAMDNSIPFFRKPKNR